MEGNTSPALNLTYETFNIALKIYSTKLKPQSFLTDFDFLLKTMISIKLHEMFGFNYNSHKVIAEDLIHK